MKALNLFAFTRIETDYAAEYMNMLSARETRERCRPHEFLTIKKLVEILLDNGVPVRLLDGFFFSYTIGQIGKEFDLLKIEKDRVILNIELKSEAVPLEEIEKQLRKNRYYLGFAAPDIRLFTFVAATGEFYQLVGDSCFRVSCEALLEALPIFKEYLTADIEKLFEPKQFLISPFTDPDKFLKGKYFLTQQQQEIREKILAAVRERTSGGLFGITGGTGSGKTLLLYDIARTLAASGHSCCVIHSGELCQGHGYLKERWDHVEICPIRTVREAGSRLPHCEYLFVDEAHRLHRRDLDLLLAGAEKNPSVLIFSYDNDPWLSHAEKQQDIPARLASLEGFTEWLLSRRIRTGLEIAAFCRNMLDLNTTPRGILDYSHIDVLFAGDAEEAEQLQNFYRTCLHYHCPGNQTSGFTIGQEYDNVLLILPPHVHYSSEGTLVSRNVNADAEASDYSERGTECKTQDCPECSTESKDPDCSGSSTDCEESDFPESFLYRNITRTRGSLCILVAGNYNLFQQIAGIKYRMLERMQYRENSLPAALSGKQLSRLFKAVKEASCVLPEEDRRIAEDTLDIIQEQLTRSDGSRKVLQNGLHVLEHLCRDYRDRADFIEAVVEYIGCLSAV